MLISDQEIVSEFRVESAERIDLIEQILLQDISADQVETTTEINNLYREFHTMKGNASFIGLSNMVDLCHTAEEVLKYLIEDDLTWGDAVETTLLKAVDRLRVILNDPADTRDLDVNDVIEQLKSFQTVTSSKPTVPLSESPSTKSDSLEPLSESELLPSTGSSLPAAEMPTIRYELPKTSTSDVYRISLLKSQRLNSGNMDDWLTYRLSGLGIIISQSSDLGIFAESILDELKVHDYFKDVDRVCLASKIPNVNRLSVVDVACSKRVTNNSMKVGYSCYTDPKGSLFNLKPGMIRIFGQAKSVIDSFHQQKKPVQRSIGKLAAMGLKSGICLAIGVNNTTEGFLFLNSQTPDLFSDVDVRFSFPLSYLVGIARIELLRHGFGVRRPEDRRRCVPFTKENFFDQMSIVLESLFVKPTAIRLIDRHNEVFLYDPKGIAEVFARCLFELWGSNMPLENETEIHIGRCGSKVSFRLLHQSKLDVNERLRCLLTQMNLSHGYDVHFNDKVIDIRFPFEEVSDRLQDNHYSVLQ